MNRKELSFYFTPRHKENRTQFCKALRDLLAPAQARPLVFLCIGSDRATGDSLGPIVGGQLSPALRKRKKADVFGCLEQTVHAGNLSETLSKIQNRYQNPFIVAIDASLGIPEHTGYITLGNGCLRPGIGVNRDLPPAGDIHITGIVNHSTENNYMALQTTHLSTVVSMANFISSGILEVLEERPENTICRKLPLWLHDRSSLQCAKQGHFINIL